MSMIREQGPAAEMRPVSAMVDDLASELLKRLGAVADSEPARRAIGSLLRDRIDESLGVTQATGIGPPRAPIPLKLEIATYRARLPELLAHLGEYVLIKGYDIIGFFPDRSSARQMGYDRFGYVPMLIKEIQEKERIYYIPGFVP